MEKDIDIDDLTDTCIRNVFRYLTIADRLIAGKVCQRWDRLEKSFSHDVRMYDCFDPNWLFVFDEGTDDFNYDTLFSDMMLQYGSSITHLKYNGSKKYESVPVFPLHYIMHACPELKYIQRFDNVLCRSFGSTIKKYKRIIEFRTNRTFRVSGFLRKMFSINRHLECLHIIVSEGTKNCLVWLIDQPIKEFGIVWRCRGPIDQLKTVVKHLIQLQTLDITYPDYVVPDRLFNAISKRKKLTKLTIRTLGLSRQLLSTLLELRHLIELNLQRDTQLSDAFLRRLVSVSPQLKCLNVSDCICLTDGGLKDLSQLSSLEKLYVDGTIIKGDGLMKIKSLRYLSCRNSTIFDEALGGILRFCSFIEFLDIRACPNITIATLEHAKRMIAVRDDRIKLEIHLDYELLNEEWVENSELLDFVCERSSLLKDENSQCRILYRSKGKSSYTTCEVIKFLESIGSWDNDVPDLNDDCLYHIFSFLSILDQIHMRIVSDRWNGLLKTSPRVGNSFDTTTTEWRLFQFDRTFDEIDNCLIGLFESQGRTLKRVKFDDAHLLLTLTNLCPNLESLHLLVTKRDDSPLIWQHQCCNLTTLSLGFNNTHPVDKSLGRVFELNRNLKFVSLFWMRQLKFTCLLHLNPRIVEKLHLYSVFVTWDTDIGELYLRRALSSFKNLRDLLIVPGNFTSKCALESFRRSTDIEILTLVHGIDGTGFPHEFQHIFQLQRLTTLVLHSFAIVKDNILAEMRNRFSELAHIDITDCHYVTDEGLRIIAAIPNLHTLIINKLTKIRGSALLLSSSLRHLECERCYNIQNDHLCRVLENCSNLKFLNVVDCPKLNEGIIETAFEIASARTNNVLLKLLTSLPSARQKRLMAPPLLRIFFTNDDNNR